MKITYDPAANAIYVRLAGSQDVDAGETTIDEDGVIIDTDAQGNPRGYEFLSVRGRAMPLAHLPGNVADALSDFVSSGALQAEDPVERRYETG